MRRRQNKALQLTKHALLLAAAVFAAERQC
jgi:hypothetical protein